MLEVGPFRTIVVAATLAVLAPGCYMLEEKWTEEAYERSAMATARTEAYPTCCESPKDIPYRVLTNDRVIADFAPGFSDMRRFATGRSYFVGIEIQDGQIPDAFYLQTEMTDARRGSVPTIFVPSVQFLDESFRLTRMPYEPQLCFYRGFRKKDVGYFAKINRVPEGTRYMIVYSDRQALGRPVSYSSSATTSAAGALPVTVNVNRNYPRSLEGVVQIWASGDRALERSLDESCRWFD